MRRGDRTSVGRLTALARLAEAMPPQDHHDRLDATRGDTPIERTSSVQSIMVRWRPELGNIPE
jgi:hypothetical protein